MSNANEFSLTDLRRLICLRWNLCPVTLQDFYGVLTASRPASDPWFAQNAQRFECVTARLAAVCPLLDTIFWDVRFDLRGRCWRADVMQRSESESDSEQVVNVSMDNSKFHSPFFRIDVLDRYKNGEINEAW